MLHQENQKILMHQQKHSNGDRWKFLYRVCACIKIYTYNKIYFFLILNMCEEVSNVLFMWEFQTSPLEICTWKTSKFAC